MEVGHCTFLYLYTHITLVLICHTGSVTAYIDTTALPQPTVRHNKRALLLSQDDPIRCAQCSAHWQSLAIMATRHSLQPHPDTRTAPSSHTNYRYLSIPEKVDRMRQLHECSRSAQKKLHRLKARVCEMMSKKSVGLDAETASDLCTITQQEEENICSKYPEDSFQRVFWQQQKEALSNDKEACVGTQQ